MPPYSDRPMAATDTMKPAKAAPQVLDDQPQCREGDGRREKAGTEQERYTARNARARSGQRCDRTAAAAAERQGLEYSRSRKSGHSVSVTYISVYASCPESC
jgi:hypothetical protein